MTSVCLWALGAVGVFASYTYLGYPILLTILAAMRRRQRPPVALPSQWPTISILLPAYNEEAVIRDTLETLLRLDYPAGKRQILVVSDASTDRTDAIVGEYAGRGVELLRLPQRRGKTAAENAALPLLRGEVIVNTDASVYVERGALKALVASFADPTVGVASACHVSVASERRHSNAVESWYVRYEMWVRDLESRVAGIAGAGGCLYAVRAPIQLRVLPESVSRDFAAGLVARELGWRAVSVRDAICYVPRIRSLRREYRRKVRTMMRGIETLYHHRRLLNPVRYGLFSWILASHKLCRWLIPHAAIVALAALTGLAWTAPWARWALGLAGSAALCTALAWWWTERRPLPKLVAVPAHLVMGNVAPLHASIRVARGEGAPIWEPTRRESVRPAVG